MLLILMPRSEIRRAPVQRSHPRASSAIRTCRDLLVVIGGWLDTSSTGCYWQRRMMTRLLIGNVPFDAKWAAMRSGGGVDVVPQRTSGQTDRFGRPTGDVVEEDRRVGN